LTPRKHASGCDLRHRVFQMPTRRRAVLAWNVPTLDRPQETA
jgi:hypothetical protein